MAELSRKPWSDSRYQPIRMLGRGGFGDVVLAHDQVRGHQVAIKRLHSPHPETTERLRQEFRALKDIDHRNLVTLYELSLESDNGFFTMEVVEGTPITEFVRAQPESQRVETIRSLLGQLVEGIDTLHDHGLLHRDIKPSNVLVTSTGRLVVLDAGLAKRIDNQPSSDMHMAGTAAYAAPEQLLGETLSTASDWYSLGVVAFELFSETRPHQGEVLALLHAKTCLDAPPLESTGASVPTPDAEVVNALLSREPSSRPTVGALREWLGTRKTSVAMRPFDCFVGRAEQLAALDAELSALAMGSVRLTRIVGAAGMGKSELVRRWVANLASDKVVVLSGRCYQRESVPFAGFEDIFAHLSEHRGEAIEDLDKLERLALSHAFGHRMGIDPQQRATLELPPDAFERRRLVSRGLAALMRNVALDRQLVIWIDDIQWAGAETGLLLSDLARSAWPAGCLVVVSQRPTESSPESGCIAAIRRMLTCDREIELRPLSELDAKLLAQRAFPNVDPARRDRVATSAGGHPLLLLQGLRASQSDEALELDALLHARVDALSEVAQRLLLVLCVAAEPIAERSALTAAQGLPTGVTSVQELLASGLAVRAGRLGDKLMPFHDSLREALCAALSTERKRELTLLIARALELTGQGEPEVLCRYFLAAEEPELAARFALAAAQRLTRELAFERAASLYQVLLELPLERNDDERGSLELALAEALINSGHNEHGARVLLRAATRRGTQSPETLVARAATELIRAGHLDEGVEIARPTFQALGVQLASSSLGALPSIALGRARLKLRGTRYVLRPESDLPPRVLARIDWCQALGSVLPVVDTLRGFQVHTQGVLWALKAGEPTRLARALAMESGFQMVLSGGNDPKGEARRLLETARVLAEGSTDHRAQGLVEIIAGSTRWSAGDWLGCIECVERGVEILRRHCKGVAWEINFGQTHALDALAWTGQLRRGREIIMFELQDARSRGDLYAETMYTLRDLPTLHLLDDRIDAARSCSKVLASWHNSGFQIEHMVDLYKQTEVDIYARRGLAAHDRIEANWPKLARAQLMRFQPFRIEMRALRARAAISAAAASTSRRAELTRLARQLRGKIDSEPASVRGDVFGAPVAAASLWLEGQPGAASERLSRGIEAAKAARMRLHEAAMKIALSKLKPHEHSSALSEAIEWMRSEGIASPESYAYLLVPIRSAAESRI